MEIVKIPIVRIQMLNGPNGETKNHIEKEASVSLSISTDGEVEITGDMANVYFAKNVVKAIGRGFSSKDALRLLKEGFELLIIDLKGFAHTENAMSRIKGRIIGEDGKVKTEIENATESWISVYGSTVSIISKYDSMEYAKEAIMKILDGSPHSAVFNYLAKIKREILSQRLKN
ncbi:RNA-processing protein [Candidatus Micrarchaeota archaeon]|nr:RNA-processing protein [Candidatus Micrarchaeota archaeon]